VGRLPERTHLLRLTPGGESLALDGEDDEVLQVIDSRICEAALPIDHGTAADAEQVSQFALRQPEPGAHSQHHLSKGVVSLAVRGLLHGRSPFLLFHTSAVM
jgi:hypothetical protein